MLLNLAAALAIVAAVFGAAVVLTPTPAPSPAAVATTR